MYAANQNQEAITIFLPFLAVFVKEITGDANTKGSSKHTGIYCNYLFIDTFGRLFNMLFAILFGIFCICSFLFTWRSFLSNI